MALTSYLDFTFHDRNPDDPGNSDSDSDSSNEQHLAVRTFRAHGGVGVATAHAAFPGGRGLGFSGAARVAGIAGAQLQQGATFGESRTASLRIATELEGHADNVGASVFGGIVAVSGTTVVSIPLGMDPEVVLWIPQTETSTKRSRHSLPDDVPFGDAVFNIAAVSVLVAALAAGDTRALRAACVDRIHQDRRFAAAPESLNVYNAMLAAGSWCAWLSGSGPSVAALCAPDAVGGIIAALPNTGRPLHCSIDSDGMRLL